MVSYFCALPVFICLNEIPRTLNCTVDSEKRKEEELELRSQIYVAVKRKWNRLWVMIYGIITG
jgi:hypothetical protein